MLMRFFSVQSETFIIVIFDSKVVLKASQNDLHLEAVLVVSVMQGVVRVYFFEVIDALEEGQV